MKYRVVFGVRSEAAPKGDTIVSSYTEARKLANNLVKVFSNDPSCTEFTDLNRTIMFLDWNNESYFVTIWPLCEDRVNDVNGTKLDEIESLLPVYEKQPDRFLLVTDKRFSPYLARIVLNGDAYNDGGHIIRWWGEPIVELYDPSYGSSPNPWLGTTGLFLTDYSMDKLLNHRPRKKLHVKIENHEWCFSKKQMKKIINWLINWRKGNKDEQSMPGRKI